MYQTNEIDDSESFSLYRVFGQFSTNSRELRRKSVQNCLKSAIGSRPSPIAVAAALVRDTVRCCDPPQLAKELPGDVPEDPEPNWYGNPILRGCASCLRHAYKKDYLGSHMATTQVVLLGNRH